MARKSKREIERAVEEVEDDRDDDLTLDLHREVVDADSEVIDTVERTLKP